MQRASSIELGPYQLRERVGEGGSGQVYRATGPSGTVAVKILGPAAELDEAARARFRREVAALAELAHPNLVTMLDHGVDPELGPYLVLPMLAGANLRELCRDRALCPEAALLLIQPIVGATAALHERGYVHRDLKPENAIASPDGSVVVIDLGLAWADSMTRHTESGAAVGSIGYMAPEQLEGRAVEARADVWAIGVMIFEWITGKRPFARARPAEEAAAALLGACSRLTAADRRASDELAELVASCLAADPAKRPSSSELARAIATMIDWAPAGQLTAERAAVIADPTSYQARVAPFRVRRLERLAREELEAGRPFAALTCCDRGLAYLPDHAPLVELIARAEAATASVGTAVTEQAPARPALGAPGAANPAPVAAAAPPPRSRRTAVIAGGALVAAIGAGIAIGATSSDGGASDPWGGGARPATAAAAASPVASQSFVRTTSSMTDADRELLSGMLGVFGKFSELAEATEAAKRDPGAVKPTSAAGWLRLAQDQPPKEAVASVRRALALSPGWAKAEDALCVVLVSAGDPDALAACDAAIDQRPDQVELRQARGVARLRGGQAAGAVADLERAVAADPSPRWRRVLGKARADAGDREGARRELAQACRGGDAVACREK